MRVLSLCVTFVSMLLGGLGCNRELPYQGPTEKLITGYQLEGYVTDRLGIPLKGVRVGLWYSYEFVDTIRSPIPPFIVDDPTKAVRVRVLNRAKKLIAVVFQGFSTVGPMDVQWDMRDASGQPAPSGVYTVDFSLNGVSKASYTLIVDGAVTATTDSLGHYVIPDENLPVGYYPVSRTFISNVSLSGNYRITPSVSLELYLDFRRGSSLTLTKDQVTRRDFVI